jgi:pyrophosphatase PpaX
MSPLPASRAALAGVLFDLDGTLLDSTELIFQSYQHALIGELGQAATPDELFLGFGQPLPEAFGAILDHRRYAAPPDERTTLVERLIAAYRAFNVAHHDRLARPFPGARSVLAELRHRGYPLGLVTSKARGIAERGLALADLAPFFAATVFMEDTRRHKPHPEPLHLGQARLGLAVPASRLLYVGDSTHDLRAGRAAGMQTGAALWGPFPPESLTALQPDYLLGAPGDLLDLCPPLPNRPEL